MKFERSPQLRVAVPLGLLVAAWCFALDATATDTVVIPQVVPIAEDVDVSPARMAKTEVTAFGGGAWSGAKWMTVKGTLVENDKPIASFRAKRYSTAAPLADSRARAPSSADARRRLRRILRNG
jgi:hypothetical protein